MEKLWKSGCFRLLKTDRTKPYKIYCDKPMWKYVRMTSLALHKGWHPLYVRVKSNLAHGVKDVKVNVIANI